MKGLEGPEFPPFKVGPICCVPGCSRYVAHTHHLWRRSALAGPFNWVELPGHQIVGNIVGLCVEHHDQITINDMWIRWLRGQFWWCHSNGREILPLYPQPPIHGAPVIEEAEQAIVGPAAAPICPGCLRPIPKPREPGGAQEGARRRKSWVVTVPDDTAEDGALVLDTLIEECRSLFSHSETASVRYFTLVQALALVVQNGHQLVSDSPVETGKS